MTLEDVADAAGVSKSYVWDLENGNSRRISLVVATRFAIALNVHIGVLAAAALESDS